MKSDPQLIRIPAPARSEGVSIGEEDELLLNTASWYSEELWHAMDLIPPCHGDRAEVFEPQITGARWTSDTTVEIDYQAEWTFHSGCRDMSAQDEIDGSFEGELVNGELVFDPFVPPEARSTHDEF
jgi:hypothetical protein